MSVLALEIASNRAGFLVGSPVLVVIGMAFIVLALGKQSEQRSAAAVICCTIAVALVGPASTSFDLGENHDIPAQISDD
jgi:multidrug efflux pump subunit AcrB